MQTPASFSQSINVPAVSAYDVIVVGGGIAGCAAALAAVREGKSVLLLEKMTMLGGLGTAGHIVIYLPLCDGYGRQVIGGIAEELLLLSTKYSFHDDVAHWRENGKRYETRYDGPAYALALEELLEQSGVAIFYDTLAVTPIMQGRRCKAVVVENKSGRRAYACGAVVDASGDAEVFSRIGVPCECAENNLAIWCYCTRGGEGHILERGGARELGLNLLTLGNIDKNAHSDVVRRPYFGSDAEEVNRFVLDGHRRLLDLAKEDADLVLASLPSMPQIRMARRIEGAYTLTEADLSAHFEDNIGATGDWRRPNPVYEIPYRTLYTPEVDNILAAGRCISATDVAWEVTRVIPPAAVTGQAAGTAAAMLAGNAASSAAALPVCELREKLSAAGVMLDINCKGE